MEEEVHVNPVGRSHWLALHRDLILFMFSLIHRPPDQ